MKRTKQAKNKRLMNRITTSIKLKKVQENSEISSE